jgi:hypothetical protein
LTNDERLLTLLVCLASALYMMGVIWTIQRVHYALFNRVGRADWQAYHEAHTRRMTGVVLVPMVLELGTSGLMILFPSLLLPRILFDLGFILALGTWATTFFLSVPLHGRLSRGWDERTWRALVGTNWARTVLWTSHAAMLLWAVWGLLARYNPA